MALLFALIDSSSGYDQLQWFPFNPSSAPLHCPHLDFIAPGISDKKAVSRVIIGISANLNLESNLPSEPACFQIFIN